MTDNQASRACNIIKTPRFKKNALDPVGLLDDEGKFRWRSRQGQIWSVVMDCDGGGVELADLDLEGEI